ncbi:DUF6766 family protein [Cytophaga hutchinsonii]|jgi:glycerol uptake facilitator-like aquaporin|uniref:Uncharacterized protein n=1 Tax=Cytophaga hutchinsonii (strain ATCC 33406 / DSM 1761 / CIP 103989 / NBRC 15051 / NCIMB 9469 / D465) TaxID=269798 RepID=A0A6N4SSZ8_CYTH3|nr:DUF6766 family protein [Cytophaga hutchinsonii]ABG59336.1 conserved hypothetical protein [Cytophaga hutchinsonii ATCC 33406]SFX92040.1 hypothetical protein SAMN04487930_11329 [Cytophaga hutchinsonii ATCC 33406]
MKKIITNNSLSLAFLLLFVLAIIGQTFFGLAQYNEQRIEDHVNPVSLLQYFSTGHFLEATFENWESEFLQMALFVIFTIFLQQKGSSESKDFHKKEDVDREPSVLRRHVPWPVKKGGWILIFYKHSLTLVLLMLFALSFVVHFYGSLKEENEKLALHHKPLETVSSFIGSSKIWFESFQNWQSEFLSVFAIIVLSIFLRQQGSSQSKPVDAPDNQTGE